MQQFLNIERQKLPSERGKGLVGAIIIHLALFAMLILVSFSVPPPVPSEEGILVNFGTDETGFGSIEPSPPAGPPAAPATIPLQKEAAAAPRTSASKKSNDEALITQNSEEAPAVKKADPEAQKKKLEKIEADKIKREELEADRIKKKQEEDERKKVEAEQQRQSDIMNRTKNALANAKNTGTNSTSEGIAGGAGNQGDPRGSVNSTVRGEGGGTGTSGNSYQLSGRNIKTFPSPKYDIQEEGTVVVEVKVDRSGKVIVAKPGVKGSTTLNENLLKLAKDAAMSARFDEKSDAAEFQIGIITYNFKFK